MSTTSPSAGLTTGPAAEPGPTDALRRYAAKGDKFFLAGCVIIGTWYFGFVGLALVLVGLYMLRKADRQGVTIRPWMVTILGGLLFVDCSVNFFAWGLDLFPTHSTLLGRTLWIDYGLFNDGGYAIGYNTTVIGGTSNISEKAMQIACVLLVFPAKMVACWGFLQMKRWGFQWFIIMNWVHLAIWPFAYAAQMTLNYPVRFGVSEFGVLGFWLVMGIPYIGCVMVLGFCHSTNRELWRN
jgi:hypothetical protein